MAKESFSCNETYSYSEAVTLLFQNLEINISKKEATYSFNELMNLKGISEYNYCNETRKFKGSIPLIIPGANVIAYCNLPNEDIAILVQNRKDINNGKYSFCGGAQQVFKSNSKFALEPPMLTAYRELYEETGLSIVNINLKYFFTDTSYIEYSNGDKVLAPSTFYLAKVPYQKLLKMSKHKCREEWTQMTHSLIKIQDINNEFIGNFCLNHRKALLEFLQSFK